jgi:precorrin-2 dehydrogenase / sirohydrochlorin ferrochelatase
MTTTLFPAFLKLDGRRCLVVGAGPVAQEKINGLLLTGARLHVVAPEATRLIQRWAGAGKIRWSCRAYRSSDLATVFLVIAATSSSSLHARIYREARRRGIFCNVADDPEHCDFYYGAVVRRGALQVAISTGGHSPALAQRLKKKIQQEFGSEYESWLAELGKARKKLFAKNIPPEQRRMLLHQLASQTSFESFRRQRKPRRETKRP